MVHCIRVSRYCRYTNIDRRYDTVLSVNPLVAVLPSIPLAACRLRAWPKPHLLSPHFTQTMRLLLHSDTGELSIHSFGIDETIPPYAILSHTWGADAEEVTFEDLARQDGLQYFWVDTCCIDKKSEVELSQAINSMFRWYRNAIRCYVYLSDVMTRERKRDENSKGIWESEFRKSRWLTRG